MVPQKTPPGDTFTLWEQREEALIEKDEEKIGKKKKKQGMLYLKERGHVPIIVLESRCRKLKENVWALYNRWLCYIC